MNSTEAMMGNATAPLPQSKLPLTILAIHFLAAFYMPFVLLFFYQRRQYPSIRHGNPNYILLMGMFCAVYCLTDSGMLLFYKILPVSTGLYSFFTTLVLLLAMYTIFVSDTILVINFANNLMLVEVHRCPQNKDANKAKQKRIARLLSFKRLPWVMTSYIVFCLPVTLYVATHSKESAWTLEGGWDTSITTDMRNLSIVQCALLLLGTSIHGYVVGPGARNNFVLRNPYHLTQRLLATCFIVYLVIAVVVPVDQEMLRLALGSTLTHLTLHIVFILHLLLPLVRTRNELCLQFHTTPFNDKDSWEALHAELLSLFLATSGGFTQYTNFMQVHLLPVVWVLAYHDITQHTLLPQAIYNLYIRRSSILCVCQYFPAAMLEELDITFERNVITSGSKDLYEMFDPVTKLLLQLLVIETFPQFQLHPLGCVWQSFVANCSDQVQGLAFQGGVGNRPLSTILSGGLIFA